MLSEAIVGIDLGGTNVRVGKVRGQKLESRHRRRICAHATEENVLDEIFDAVDQVLDGDVVGIGCGVPSVVDVDRGIVYTVENIPSWREVHLKDALESRYHVPAFINNDANAFVLGEMVFGKGQGYRNIVGLTLGTGLGAGIVIDGRLYSGTNCGAGEIGMIPYRDEIIESYCAGPFFQRRSGVAGDVVFERAQQGDEQALQLYEAYGREFGHAVMTVLYAYDPELIVLGGSISKAFALFEGGMRERLKQYAYQHALERLVIACSETEDVAVLGAAALYLDARDRGERRDP
ncbi:MAG: ROK family protein [bacterium]|nr:ROK family protein [bacterium]